MAFDPLWLGARFPYDAAVRSTHLCTQVVEQLRPSEGPWVLIDVGSGLGANVLHGARELPGPQRWWLVDQDDALLAQAPQALSAQAEQRCWTYKAGPPIQLDRPQGTVEIALCRGLLTPLPPQLPLDQAHLVTANALFDLLSPQAFATFIAQLGGKPLWATLNYTAMAFEGTPDPDDHWVIDRYQAHMQRPGAGLTGAMGPSCSDTMATLLTEAGYRVLRDDSVWQLGPDDATLISFVLGFMAQAVPEMCTPNDHPRFTAWLDRRRNALAHKRLGLRVEHGDLLAL